MPKFILNESDGVSSSYRWPAKSNIGDTIALKVSSSLEDQCLLEEQIQSAIRQVKTALFHPLTFIFFTFEKRSQPAYGVVWIRWRNPQELHWDFEINFQPKSEIESLFGIQLE